MGSVGCLLHHGSNRFRGAACIGVCGVCMCTCVRAHSRGRRPGISDPTVLQNPPGNSVSGVWVPWLLPPQTYRRGSRNRWKVPARLSGWCPKVSGGDGGAASAALGALP